MQKHTELRHCMLSFSILLFISILDTYASRALPSNKMITHTNNFFAAVIFQIVKNVMAMDFVFNSETLIKHKAANYVEKIATSLAAQ